MFSNIIVNKVFQLQSKKKTFNNEKRKKIITLIKTNLTNFINDFTKLTETIDKFQNKTSPDIILNKLFVLYNSEFLDRDLNYTKNLELNYQSTEKLYIEYLDINKLPEDFFSFAKFVKLQVQSLERALFLQTPE